MVFGQEINLIGNWFKLHFTENPGMAFGFEFAGENGKLALTLFRILAVMGITWFMLGQIKKQAHRGFVISIALILAGAMGNIIDSVFYGVAFDYAPLMHGRVVDMFSVPLFTGYYPDWVPYLGGNHFIFFRPIFNIADASISIGVLAILFFQKKFFKKAKNEPNISSEIDSTEFGENDNMETQSTDTLS